MRQRLLWDLHERRFGRFNVTIGSSRIASPAYHDWPTNDKYSYNLGLYLNKPKLAPIQSLRLDEGYIIPHFPNHSLYQMQLRICRCYPKGNFGGNQLLDGSISLSPLYPSLTINLHVRTASNLHQGFPWLRPTRA